jgi:hypothetical protein
MALLICSWVAVSPSLPFWVIPFMDRTISGALPEKGVIYILLL